MIPIAMSLSIYWTNRQNVVSQMIAQRCHQTADLYRGSCTPCPRDNYSNKLSKKRIRSTLNKTVFGLLSVFTSLFK